MSAIAWRYQPRRRRVERPAPVPCFAVDVAGRGQPRDPGLSTTSTRGIVPKMDSRAFETGSASSMTLRSSDWSARCFSSTTSTCNSRAGSFLRRERGLDHSVGDSAGEGLPAGRNRLSPRPAHRSQVSGAGVPPQVGLPKILLKNPVVSAKMGQLPS